MRGRQDGWDALLVVFDEALTVARSITNANNQANALRLLANALLSSDQMKANQLFDEALTAARSIADTWNQAKALESLAQALNDAQRFDEALITARSISHATMHADVLSRSLRRSYQTTYSQT